MPPRSLARAAALAAALALPAPAAAQAPAFIEHPCRDDLPGARCGTVTVPENREQPGGRTIALNVIVLPARAPERAREAVIFFAGGPGQPSTPMAGGFARQFAALREDRDLLFVDQRGTGRSAPLQCRLRDPADPQSYLGDYFPPAAVARCLDELRGRADLTRYGYPELAHDVDAVRAALGYERLDLWGGSYGTRAAQVYMRTYPHRVRSAVLQGVVPPGYLQPAAYAQDVEAALAGLFAECRVDAACHAAFPDPARELRQVAERLESRPAAAEIVDPQSGARLRLTLTRDAFADMIRKLLYEPALASMTPFVVHRAWEGDFRPAARLALMDRRNAAEGIWWGLTLSVTCSEDVAFIDSAAAARDNGRTFLGDYRVRQQTAACRGWPRYSPPADYHALVRLEIPTLLVSGALDPVTPPRWAERALQALPNGVHVVVPHAGHSYNGMRGAAACMDPIILRFYQQGSARGLDTSCVQRIQRPPFVISMAESIALEAAALDRLAGEYASPGTPLRIRFERVSGGLRATANDGDTVVATPLSSTEFRFEGLPPGFAFVFSPDARTVTMRIPGEPDLVLSRTP
ncbi:MAG TPA: alpha/beta hydrolase [Longimicrobium sp.]|nr:alpha/beta hydrolase [Longimicrobium sp.]